jgi:TetR/AcrR family transcriptional regulator, cholesterol catabolism regulator
VETSRRREIEDAASSLFRAHGYAATSVREIARALDIQGASLYAHVSSKQDVLWAIVDRVATAFEDAATAALPALGRPTMSPITTLDALARAHVGVVLADIESATVFVNEWRSLEPRRRAEIATRRDRYEHCFREVIAQGVADGSFGAVHPVASANFILTALNGLVTWYDVNGRLTPLEIADAYVVLTRRAVGQDPAS